MRIRRTRQFWSALVKESQYHEGTLNDFCSLKGVSQQSFYAWKRKLKATQEPTNSSFLKVEVDSGVETHLKGLPDPKWVALVILEIAKGLK